MAPAFTAGYQRMGAELGRHDPRTAELVAKARAARRRASPPDRWEGRVVWLDRVLMALPRCRRCRMNFAERSSAP